MVLLGQVCVANSPKVDISIKPALRGGSPMLFIQPECQKSLNAVKNLHKNRMQLFANLINPLFINIK